MRNPARRHDLGRGAGTIYVINDSWRTRGCQETLLARITEISRDTYLIKMQTLYTTAVVEKPGDFRIPRGGRKTSRFSPTPRFPTGVANTSSLRRRHEATTRSVLPRGPDPKDIMANHAPHELSISGAWVLDLSRSAKEEAYAPAERAAANWSKTCGFYVRFFTGPTTEYFTDDVVFHICVHSNILGPAYGTCTQHSTQKTG